MHPRPSTRSGARVAARLLQGVLVVLSLLIVTARPAGAHASLQGASPAPDETLAEAPQDVTLLFDEPVQASLGGVRVFDPDGRRVDRGRAASRVAGTQVTAPVSITRDGTYTVAWAVVSDDGHSVSGSFVFSVGSRSGSGLSVDRLGSTGAPAGVDALGWLARTLAFAGTSLAIGLVALTAGSARSAAQSRQALVLTRPRMRLLAAGFALAAIGAAVALLAQTATAAATGLGGALGALGEAVRTTRFGRLGALRVAALAAAALASARAVRRAADAPAGGVAARPLLADAGAVIGVMVPAISGHAWTRSPRALSVLADAVHFAAAAAWVGGFAVLLLEAGRWSPAGSGGEQPAADRHGPLHTLVARFSARAAVWVVAVLATGAYSAWRNLGGVGALVDNGYGRLVLAKAVGALTLALLGWINRRTVAAATEQAARRVIGRLRGEVLVGVLLLALAAALVNRPPSTALDSQPVTIAKDLAVSTSAGAATAGAEPTAEAALRRVSLTVFPARKGSNDVHLYFTDRRGLPAGVDVAELRATAPGLPPRTLDLLPVTDAHYQVRGADLPLRGTWRIDVTVSVDGIESSAAVEVPIR